MAFKLSEMEKPNLGRLQLIGDFDAADAGTYEAHLEPLLTKANDVDAQLNLFVDTSEFGALSVEGRRTMSRVNADDRLGRVAATGGNRILRMMGRFIMVASGNNNIRFFETEDEALEWLSHSD